MKALTTNGLTKLIQLIKDTFIKKTDVVETSTLDIDTSVTSASTNLITSGAVASYHDSAKYDVLTNLTLSQDTSNVNIVVDNRNYLNIKNNYGQGNIVIYSGNVIRLQAESGILFKSFTGGINYNDLDNKLTVGDNITIDENNVISADLSSKQDVITYNSSTQTLVIS